MQTGGPERDADLSPPSGAGVKVCGAMPPLPHASLSCLALFNTGASLTRAITVTSFAIIMSRRQAAWPRFELVTAGIHSGTITHSVERRVSDR